MRITLSRIYIAKNDIAKNDTDMACNSGSEACVPQNNLEELVKYIVAWVPPHSWRFWFRKSGVEFRHLCFQQGQFWAKVRFEKHWFA